MKKPIPLYKQLNHCIDCGIKIDYRSKRCSVCASKECFKDSINI